MQLKPFRLILVIVTIIGVIISCSKKGGGSDAPPDPCAGKTITIAAVATEAAPGTNNGTITVTASGSSGFTYSINGSAFASANVFSNLASGDYTISVKDNAGCTKQTSVRVNAADACAGKNFVFSPAITNADKCAMDGRVTLTVTGGTGFQYKLNGGAYQASNAFTSIAAGTHTFFAKDAAGCEKSTSVAIPEKPAGPLFSAVKNLIQIRCANCHTNGGNDGGVNFDTDCNIVAKKDRIKIRAVDLGTMPPTGPLNATEKQRITDWINAGGMHSN